MVFLLIVVLVGISSGIEVKLVEAFPGLRFEKPIFLLESPLQEGRFYILEQRGVVKTVKGKEVEIFLDLRDRVVDGGEMGLLGMVFDPKRKDLFYVYYTDREMNSVVSRFRMKNTIRAERNSEMVILKVKQPFSNHNGGMIAFGPDGYLYIALGDGGSAGDPYNNAQNTNTLLGSILRIDVSKEPYGIPPDNPFVKGGGQKEIYAWGFRNPWRFSFDRETGELWVGDVGQNRWEEINVVERGGNYGWRCYEGFAPFNLEGCGPKENYRFPVHVYPLEDGNCAVIGGYAYRGQVEALKGWYIFGDYCSGRIWALREKKVRLLLDTELNISSFAEDNEGNLYVIDHGGKIYLLSD